jgi:hypothetical protein
VRLPGAGLSLKNLQYKGRDREEEGGREGESGKQREERRWKGEANEERN